MSRTICFNRGPRARLRKMIKGITAWQSVRMWLGLIWAGGTLLFLTCCDPARVKEVHVAVSNGKAQAMRFVHEVDKIARVHGFQPHPDFLPQFPNRIGFWNRKASEGDRFTTLGCEVSYAEAERLLKVRVVRFPGTSLTPAGEGLYRDITALIEKRGFSARVVFDD